MDLKAQGRNLLKLAGAGILTVVLLCVLAFVGLAVLFPYRSPPKEAEVIRNFETHRATFERLREMLVADKDLLRVADWGIETTKTGIGKPADGDFPLGRYNDYLLLLKEVGGVGGFRDRGDPPEGVGVLVYASGFAGDTRHMEICWVTHEPQNLVLSLDDFYKAPKPRKPVYRHLEGHWYLWADW